LASPERHVGILAICLPRALLLMFIMATGDGLRAFGLGRIKMVDWARATLCAAGAYVIAASIGLALSSIGVGNPLLANQGPRASIAIMPLVLASSAATGYCEELFFRAYLMRRLGQAGLSAPWAAIATSLLFAGAHAEQGAVGLVAGFLLGLFFAWRWASSSDIHEIALGHGLYDAAVYAIAMFA
jgi:CAAX amino terminal protease family.